MNGQQSQRSLILEGLSKFILAAEKNDKLQYQGVVSNGGEPFTKAEEILLYQVFRAVREVISIRQQYRNHVEYLRRNIDRALASLDRGLTINSLGELQSAQDEIRMAALVDEKQKSLVVSVDLALSMSPRMESVFGLLFVALGISEG